MKKNKAGTVPVLALTLAVLISTVPAGTVHAGQQNSYHDPLEHWVDSADRTGELDINAVVTSEVSFCGECRQNTKFTMFRTPEYTKDGVSAVAQGIQFSDGTKSDGESKGVISEGNAYTGYHWTKSVCTKCGSINSNTGYTSGENFYANGRNVYIIYDCAESFMKPLEEKVTCTVEGSEYHRITKKTGSYCGICYGTVRRENSVLEAHHFEKKIIPQPDRSRFEIRETCSECGYSRTQYLAAKSVIANYYGKADGKTHTISVTPLSDDGVSVAVYYGNSAESCNLTTAPSYRKAGDYPVYYRIVYQYEGGEMTENGVSYVLLRNTGASTENQSETEQADCACGDPECCCGDDCDGTNCGSECTTHQYRVLEKIDAACDTEGYERYVCRGCGKIIEKNRVEKLGHEWETVVIRESDCVTEGKVLKICRRCGKADYETVPRGEHQYVKRTVQAACTLPGYTLTECTVCGERVINGITSALPHQYDPHKVEASCLAGGHTLHRCEGCGSSFITDYTTALGHEFDEGMIITDPTCTGSGVMEYDCTLCGYRKIEGTDSSGHEPGEEATCNAPQICIHCGAVIKSALGHDYQPEIVEPTETELGYTLYTCTRCGDSYKTDYVQTLPRKDDGADPEDRQSGKVTDHNGKVEVGDYLIFINDTVSGDAIEGAYVSLKDNGAISVVLPDGRMLDASRPVTVTVLNNKTVKPVKDVDVTVSDTAYDRYSGVTGSDGTVTVPPDEGISHVLESHSVYMYGYPDRSFRADGNMTRAEASAVFARLLAERRGEDPGTFSEKNAITFYDVPKSQWYSSYIHYLSSFGIISGEDGGAFRPDDSITRSELTAIAVRFYNVFASQKTAISSGTGGFSDVEQGDWASGYIDEAYSRGWIRGYGDGTFRGQNRITRAEMITITNSLLNRVPDQEYIDSNSSRIVKFMDLGKHHWAYYQIMEASNGHRSDLSDRGETWLSANTAV